MPLTSMDSVAAMTRHRGAATGRTADPVRPAMLPDQREAFRVVEQGGELHQERGGHGHQRAVRESSLADGSHQCCLQLAPTDYPETR
jgi:hypothetical protein